MLSDDYVRTVKTWMVYLAIVALILFSVGTWYGLMPDQDFVLVATSIVSLALVPVGFLFITVFFLTEGYLLDKPSAGESGGKKHK